MTPFDPASIPHPKSRARELCGSVAVSGDAARVQLVNRTHRIVRERAQSLKSQRSRGRSLWIPMAISAAFLLILCTAIWSLLDQYELTPTGIPDASSQIFIFFLWFFPVSAAILALAWAHRAHADRESL